MNDAAAIWRRFESPGHDAARLTRAGNGWILEGSAVFVHDAAAAAVNYSVTCDEEWRSRKGRITGWAGATRIAFAIERQDDLWLLDGHAVAGLEHCVDLDFGFTPATNFFQLKRIALQPGERATFDVAWFDLGERTLRPLEQRYERRSANTYWYESPSFGYTAELVIAPSGFVQTYPDLFELLR